MKHLKQILKYFFVITILLIVINLSYISSSVGSSSSPSPSSSVTLYDYTSPLISPSIALTLPKSSQPVQTPEIKSSYSPKESATFKPKPSTSVSPKVTTKPIAKPTPKPKFSIIPKPSKNPIPTASSTSKVRIYSDEALYDRKNKFAFVKGKVKIIQDNITIYTDEAKYDEKTKISYCDGPVKIVQWDKEQPQRKTVITGKKMTVWHELKKILLQEDVRLDREEDQAYKTPANKPKDKKEKQERVEKALKKERTVVTSNVLEYWTKKKDAIFFGNVVFLQKDKKSTGDRAQMIDAQKTITLDGNAKVIQIKGDWLVKEKIMEKEKDDIEQERIIKEKLVITANRIDINQNTNDIIATGNVVVIQKVGGVKERIAKSDKAVYIDKDGLLTLSGNVKIEKENKDWMTAEKAIIYTETETFKAYGTGDKQIESEITAEESASPEPVGTSEPDFDLNKHTPLPVLPDWLKQ